jgi:long-chain-fatty-acid--CoA ligase ACSBG
MTEEYNKGPDQIKAAEHYFTSDPEGAVKLRIGEEGISSRPPVSIPGVLDRIAAEFGDRPALCFKDKDEYESINFREYKEQVHHMAKAFIKLGLRQRHTVCILGFNSTEWFIADLAAITAGGIAAGVYPTNSAEATHHILIDSRADIVVVDDLKQYQKILTIKGRLPNLKAIVQIQGPFGEPADNYYHWSDLQQMDVSEYQGELEKRLSKIAVNECCLLVYTSGTVGAPKGVMLSHDNLTYNGFVAGSYLQGGVKMGEEVIVSYLPLSHIAAQLVDIYGSLMYAITVYFADRDALKGSLVRTLQEARPTRLLGVPRVYEKIRKIFIC